MNSHAEQDANAHMAANLRAAAEAYDSPPPATREVFDVLRAQVRAAEQRHDAQVRAAAYRQCADDLDADADRLAARDPRAAEVLNGAAYLIRTRAEAIAPTTEEQR